MRTSLQHAYPMWEPPEDDLSAPIEDYRKIWRGKARIVRSPKRARKLRRRGVPLLDARFRTARGHTVWFWFVEEST